MRLQELILQAKHLDELDQFYKTVLQLQVTQTNSKSISLKAGKTTLIFQQTNLAAKPFYHFAFNIPSNKIEEAFQWLKTKVKLLWIEEYKSYIAEFASWHARSVYFIDPAGNIVEFIARFDLHNDDAEPFSSSQILNISEIGIVFEAEKFNERAEELLQQSQLQYFSKQPPMQHFRAVGSDEGLFIVVPQQRNWYPTNIQSAIFPLSISLENKNTEYHLQL
jgi:extradiol dioxygenase family protein